MRFSTSLQHVLRLAPPARTASMPLDDARKPPLPVLRPAPVHEPPMDLDQRVRLIGEW